MTRARRELVDLDRTSYYHCICRCVRRAFLCGEDHLTGNSYEHRKSWVVERLAELGEVFALDLCAYAVMSNHYHVVVRIDREKAIDWSEEQVMERWRQLYKLPLLIERYQKGLSVDAERKKAQEIIELWRERLMDLSWYMRSLNEYLARKANAEDGCKGRFWEGRYKSQALLDQGAVLTCMSYVDLNPVRAGVSATPEESPFTSIQCRIRQWNRRQATETPVMGAAPSDSRAPGLMPLVRQTQDPHIHANGYGLDDYLQLVDWAGRSLRQDKRGTIPADIPPILARLNLNPRSYLDHVQGHRPLHIYRAIGNSTKLAAMVQALKQTFLKGSRNCAQLYLVPAPD